MIIFFPPDIAATSVEQSESRFKDMLQRSGRERNPDPPFDAEFITADCSKVSWISVKYYCAQGPFLLTFDLNVRGPS